ncbi:hypothetical protein J1614_003784 [Plenodomus biglobosus]|nr:hypothetical protein J1614_003784 [Plenodomus biglobosus]
MANIESGLSTRSPYIPGELDLIIPGRYLDDEAFSKFMGRIGSPTIHARMEPSQRLLMTNFGRTYNPAMRRSRV